MASKPIRVRIIRTMSAAMSGASVGVGQEQIFCALTLRASSIVGWTLYFSMDNSPIIDAIWRSEFVYT